VPQATRNDKYKTKSKKRNGEKRTLKKTTTMQMRLQNVTMHSTRKTQMTKFFSEPEVLPKSKELPKTGLNLNSMSMAKTITQK
jgi:hypothetical protein